MSGPPPAGSSGAASGPLKTEHWRQSIHAKANDFRKQPWYQQDASTAVATELLMAKKRGDFLLRFAPERVTNPAMKDDFVLSVKGEDKVYHVLLHAEPFEGHQYYHVKPTGHCFQDMFDIIQFGSKFPFHFPASDGAQLQITLNVAEVPKSKQQEAQRGGIVKRLSTAFSDKDEMEKWITASQTEEETQLNKVHQKQREAELKAKKDEADKEVTAAAKAHAEAEARASHENKTAAQEAAAREREEQMRAEREYAEKTERERRALAQKMGKPTHETNQAHNHPLDQERDKEQFCTLKRLASKKGTPLLPDVNSQFNSNA